MAETKEDGTADPYFDDLDPAITGGGGFRAFYNKLATSKFWPVCYDYHGKSPTQELERRQEYQEQEIKKGLAIGQSTLEIRNAWLGRDTQRTAWAKAALEREEWALEVKERKERQRAAHEKAIQERAREARERAEWRKAFQAKREREDAEWELETKKRVDQEREAWEKQEWILREKERLQESILRERKKMQEVWENFWGEHTWGKTAAEALQQRENTERAELDKSILREKERLEDAIRQQRKITEEAWEAMLGKRHTWGKTEKEALQQAEKKAREEQEEKLQKWILQAKERFQASMLQRRKETKEMWKTILGEHTWGKTAEEVMQQTINEWEKGLQEEILRERAIWERATQERIDQERAEWKKYRGKTQWSRSWRDEEDPEEDPEEEAWREEVRDRQKREFEVRRREEDAQTEREEKSRLQLKEDRRKQAIPGLRAYLDSWPIPVGDGPLQIILQYLSGIDRDELLPCVPYIQAMRDKSALDKVVAGDFMSLDGGSITPTIALEEWAEKIPGADGTTLYLHLDLRRIIPEKELGLDHSLVLFNTKGGGSWRGSPKQLELPKGIPGSLTIHLNSGSQLHIQRGVMGDEGKTITRIALRANKLKEIPDLAAILASWPPEILKLIKGSTSLFIGQVRVSENKLQDLPQSGYQIEQTSDEGKICISEHKFRPLEQSDYQFGQVTDGRTGVKYHVAYPIWKSFVQVDLSPTTNFQFSEDQRYLMCTELSGQKLLLDTLKCRIEDMIYGFDDEQQVLIAEPRVRNTVSQQGGLMRRDTITQQQLNHTNYRVADVLNAAFSPSCESFFAICGTATPGQYALQEIDAETLVPRPASTALLPLISLPGSREDIIRGGYLKSVGNILLYFRHDGQVMRWKLGYQ